MSIKISLMINTYNNPIALDKILFALNEQIHNNNFEIIIADDGSTSLTKEVIDKYSVILKVPLLHVWHEDKGFRRAMILNKATSQASGDFIIFIDGDCIPFKDFINNYFNLIEDNCLIAGNRVLLNSGFSNKILTDNSFLEKVLNYNCFNWLIAKLKGYTNKFLFCLRLANFFNWRYLAKSNWKLPKGCNFGIFKKDFILVNGFDEAFEGWGHEDSDLFIRLLHRDIKIKNGRFAIPVLHLWHKETKFTIDNPNYRKMLYSLENKNAFFTKDGINKYL